MLNKQLISGVMIDWDKIDSRSYLREIPAIRGVEQILHRLLSKDTECSQK